MATMLNPSHPAKHFKLLITIFVALEKMFLVQRSWRPVLRIVFDTDTTIVENVHRFYPRFNAYTILYLIMLTQGQ